MVVLLSDKADLRQRKNTREEYYVITKQSLGSITNI